MKKFFKRMLAYILAAVMLFSALPATAFADFTVNKTVSGNTSDITAQWPCYRGNNNNNAVTSNPAPKTADEATLYWAAKLGDGFGFSATGAPIIVDDHIIVCANLKLYKIDIYSGDVVLTGDMSARSNFNIISPTYAHGMIFVGLSNGTVQAFDAKTLESLWIYNDILKGQPNSPIVYNNGYIYTGFWNSETKDATFVCISVEDEDKSSTNEAKTAKWTYTHAGGFYWAGAYVCDDFLLVGTDDGKGGYLNDTSSLLSLDPISGDEIDKIENLNGDIRSSVAYDDVTNRYYFTSKGGSFYSVAVNGNGIFNNINEILLDNGENNGNMPAMSTSTPVVYNGRAYIGVSGTSQFNTYSGHNITVIDLEDWEIAYKVPTKGYPQVSGLLSNAYVNDDGYAYVYFIDNYTPGQLRVIKDKPGVTEVVDGVTESYTSRGETVEVQGCAPVLFTPSGSQAQYTICSPIVDREGTIYFKNDSAYLMAVGSKIKKIEVVSNPDKLIYVEGEKFDSAGIKVIAHLTNGVKRDITNYISYSDNAFTTDDTDITIYYNYVMYGDSLDSENGNQINQIVDPLETYIDLTVISSEDSNSINSVIDKIDLIGEVTLSSLQPINDAKNAYDELNEDLQELVTNINQLIDSEKEYKTIKNTYDLIDVIGTVKYDKSEIITQARDSYDELTDLQKQKITNYNTLILAEKTISNMIDIINNVKALIENIGEVSVNSEADITLALDLYDNLEDDLKQYIDNYNKLEAAQIKLLALKGDVESVELLISSIGTVSYSKKADIQNARIGYDALNKDLQSTVSNYALLTAAEARLAELEKDIENTENLITSIKTVTINSNYKITSARNAYDKLPTELKEAVGNYAILVKAENEFAALQARIKNAENLINSIGKVTLDSEQAITDARKAFDALEDSLKEHILNYEKLCEAEKQLAEIKTVVENTENLITSIGTVTINSNDKITSARNAYDKLPTELKEAVGNYAILVKAENEFTALQARIKNAEDLINSIGKVTLDSEQAITNARKAFDALEASLKEHVTNYEKLCEAEKQLAEIKSPAIEEYIITNGANGTWVNSDNNYSITIIGNTEKFVSVSINNIILNNSLYTISEGNTVIVLSKNYLSTLSVGEYKIQINYEKGNAQTTLAIKNNTDITEPTEPSKSIEPSEPTVTDNAQESTNTQNTQSTTDTSQINSTDTTVSTDPIETNKTDVQTTSQIAESTPQDSTDKSGTSGGNKNTDFKNNNNSDESAPQTGAQTIQLWVIIVAVLSIAVISILKSKQTKKYKD